MADAVTQLLLAAIRDAEQAVYVARTEGDTFGVDEAQTGIAALRDAADMRICIPRGEVKA